MNYLRTVDVELDEFVRENCLQSADAILVKKMPTKLLNHYIIYLGTFRRRHIFMANTLSGVRVFKYDELIRELRTFQPEKIEPFVGNDIERELAVKRALMRKDEKSYNLILNNCEHYKNWVQHGVHESVQTKNAGKASVALGAGVALTSKSDGGKLLGIGLMLLGGLAWALSDDEDTMPEPQYTSNGSRRYS